MAAAGLGVLGALAAGLAASLVAGSPRGVVLTGGALVGVLLAAAWTLRYFSWGTCAVLLAVAAGIDAGLWRSTDRAGIDVFITGLAVAGAWVVLYDLVLTGWANRERPAAVTSFGGEGRAGRALIVYHSTRGRFQPSIQRAFADGLQRQGWCVEITTASHTAPVDLSSYNLLVLGVPVYNMAPARPAVSYVARLRAAGLPVAILLSGGGLTKRAMGLLRRQVDRAGLRTVLAAEIWTNRTNGRYGSGTPVEVARQLGERCAESVGERRPLKSADRRARR